MNIDADVAFLAGQNPPIKVFPKENSSHLPYNVQMAMLETDYLKYYSYRGDLKYNEKMARSVGKKGKGKCGEDETCMYRVCRDKNRFYEARIKDDALILGKILESMIERTSEMEKYLEKVLHDAGEKTMPNWDELFEYGGGNTGSHAEKETKQCSKDLNKSGPLDSNRAPEQYEQPHQQHQQQLQQQQQTNQPMMTHDQAQMLVAQMMLARSFAQPNRLQWNAQYLNSIIQTSAPSHGPAQ